MIQVLFANKHSLNINVKIYTFSSFDDLIEMIKTHMSKNEDKSLPSPWIYKDKLAGYSNNLCFKNAFFVSAEYREWYDKFKTLNKAIYSTIGGTVEINILSRQNNTTISLSPNNTEYANLTEAYNGWSYRNELPLDILWEKYHPKSSD